MATVAIIEISYFCLFCFFQKIVFLFEPSGYTEMCTAFNRVNALFFLLEMNHSLSISSLGILQLG